MDLTDVLADDADDSLLRVVEYNNNRLVLSVRIDVLNGEEHQILLESPIHIDMPPEMMLGKIVFGDSSLLPKGYTSSRNKGYEGDEVDWRVMKIIDDSENDFYGVYFGDLNVS